MDTSLINRNSSDEDFIYFLTYAGRITEKRAVKLFYELKTEIASNIVPSDTYVIKEYYNNGEIIYKLILNNDGYVVQSHKSKIYLEGIKNRKIAELRKDKLYESLLELANVLENIAIKKEKEKKEAQRIRESRMMHDNYVNRKDPKIIRIMYYMDDHKYFPYDVLKEKYGRYSNEDLIELFRFDAILSHQRTKDYNNTLDASTRNRLNKLEEDLRNQKKYSEKNNKKT